jgi:hemerythrin-like domain-containing protein
MMKTHGTELEPQERAAGRSKGTELFDLLLQDHEILRELFKKIEKSSSSEAETRKKLFTELERELLAHMEAEERFIYTALEQHDASRFQALEAFEEHQVARMVVGSFNSLAADDERWPAKLKVLSRLVRRHQDEEEHELFKTAKKVLNKDQLMGIAAKVQELGREPSPRNKPEAG